MSRLLIMGASKGLGLETVKAALASGHHVRAFSRSASSLPLAHANLDLVDGDARDAASVTHALEGQDIVIQTLGVAITPETIACGTRLFSDATRVLVDAMLAAPSPKRLIVVTGISAGNSRHALGLLPRIPFELMLGRIYADKDVQETIVNRSSLDWTLVRPGILTNGAETSCRALLDPKDWTFGSVSRAAVAAFLIAHLTDPAYLRQTPLLIA